MRLIKKKNFFIHTALILILFSSGVVWSQETSLAELYKKGQIRLEQVLLIDDEKLPEDNYFQYPMGMTSSPDGRLFVADYNAHHIKTFDSSGKFLGLIGREG